ncbi:MAG: sulfurtransferase TusA [Gammaproteobacteria bacterium]|nr:sulfurtransferase TusA [Gammaproteobacteria bacterium]|tara:strand:+ start:5015 stop:5311 length:297 start_codon:yes stop_codon:yes gene_type:complete
MNESTGKESTGNEHTADSVTVDEIDADIQVDATGLFCPEPVMLLHNRFRDMQAGDTLLMTATDPSTTRDVPKFCLFLGHELLARDEQGGTYRYLLRKH